MLEVRARIDLLVLGTGETIRAGEVFQIQAKEAVRLVSLGFAHFVLVPSIERKVKPGLEIH